MWLEMEQSGGEIMFFIGTYSHNLDDKSRLILPSKLREKLGGTVYVSLGLDKCLAVYPEEVFEQMAKQLSTVSSLNAENRSYKRIFFSSSYQCDVDKQGRIQLTKDSLEKCNIKKDVMIIGVEDHIEIWDKEKFYQMEEENEAAYESNAAKIFESKGE